MSPEEFKSPFALASLRLYTLRSGDGSERHGGLEDSQRCKGGVSVLTQECESHFQSVSHQEALRQARLAEFELDSFTRGAVRVKMRDQPFRVIQEIGPGFFNIRAPFLVLLGAADVGAHMSLIRLKTGKFIVLSALDPNG